MTTYTYSINEYFPNGVNTGQLSSEILNDTIIQTLLYSVVIDPNDSNSLLITFASALSSAELTELNAIIAAYVPTPVGEKLLLISTIADPQAITIEASNVVGGIYMESGTGGIAMTTTNSFTVTSGGETSINVTNGNLILNSTNALTNVDGYSGINIGNNANGGPININTATQRVVNIGNTLGTTSVNTNTGTGGFNVNTASGGAISLNSTGSSSNFTLTANADSQDLIIALNGTTDSSIIIESQGTGVDAISLNSVGGLQLLTQNNPLSIVSNAGVGNAISIDTSSGGGITLNSGSYGIAINASGGLIGIGNFSGGNIYVGTSSVARDIIVGNNTSGF